MKIGILTYHRSHNYGAYLQAYSLSHALNELKGCSCELINYNLPKEDKGYVKRIYKRPIYTIDFIKQDKCFKKAQKEQLLSGELILSEDYSSVLQMAEEKYDVIIVGSDEIWRIASRGFPNIYWLPGKREFIKMSYAASGRNPDSKLTPEVKEKMKEIYSTFEYIGVRDEITGKQIASIDNSFKVHRNCDPCFLYKRFKRDKKELREQICKRYKLNPNKKLIAVMYDRVDVISNLRKRLGKNYEFICIARPMWNSNKNLCGITPFEWVDVIGGCDYLISSYFHGMLFAINQDTPVRVIDMRANRNNLETSKLYDFLSYSKMLDRYNIATEMDKEKWDNLAEQIKNEIEVGIDFSEIRKEQQKLFDGFKQKLLEIKNEREN